MIAIETTNPSRLAGGGQRPEWWFNADVDLNRVND